MNLVHLRERLLVHEGHCGGKNGGEVGDAHAVTMQALLEETLDKAGARSVMIVVAASTCHAAPFGSKPVTGHVIRNDSVGFLGSAPASARLHPPPTQPRQRA